MKLKEKLNPKYTLIAAYVIVTAAIIYGLGIMLDHLPEIAGGLKVAIGWLLTVLKPVVLAFVVAYLLNPVVRFFQRRYESMKIFCKKGKSKRGLAVLTTLFLILLGLTLVISLLISSVTKQVHLASLDDFVGLVNSFASSLTGFYDTVMTWLEELNFESETLQQYLKTAGAYVGSFLQSFGLGLVSSVSNISSFVTTLLFTVVIGVYFLIDGPMMVAYWKRVMQALFSEKWNRRLAQLAQDADQVFSGYIRGQLMDACVMMVLISIVLGVTGVKFAIVIGILSGLGNLIPYVGPFVAYASTAVVCMLEGDWKRLLIALILLLIVQAIDANLIGPRLLSSNIEVHPLLVVISLIFGSAIGGLLGMLLAVPVGALIKVLFNRAIDQRLARREALQAAEVAENSDQSE